MVDEVGVAEPAADQVTEYLAAARAALGVLPTHDTIVIERFFDAVGGMQLVVHSPYGSRINRAWGLALRKRFCRKFNFEIQAAATEDNIVLSLTTAHSFDLAEVQRYLHSASVRQLLTEALLDAPMFMTRWRWVAGVALSLPRFRGGKKVPPPLLRMDAEDLLAGVFPDQIACAENLAGAREIPDHPLVRQTIADCLDEAMDAAGLERLLAGIEAGDIRVIARDLTEPSPLALEVLSARPYAYLDDAPLEERRTQAVMARRWLAPEEAEEIGRLDPQAIERVREEAWPDPANADELHDALDWLGFVTADEAQAEAGWNEWLACLAAEKRVARLLLPQVGSLPQRTHPSAVMPGLDPGIHATALTAKTSTEEEDKGVDGRDKPGHDDRTDVREGPVLWITAERLPLFRAFWPDAGLDPPIVAPAAYRQEWPRDEALVEILRGRLDGQGPATKEALAAALGLEASEIAAPLTALEAEGFALRGQFHARRRRARNGASGGCSRASTATRSAGCAPRSSRWRRATSCASCSSGSASRPMRAWKAPTRSPPLSASSKAFEAPAGAWETEILPARLADYEPAWLDDQCLAGRVAWARLRRTPARTDERGASPVRTTPITLLPRRHAPLWASLSPSAEAAQPSAKARAVADCIREHGASFFDELVEGARSAGTAGRGGAGRAGGARPRQFRQLRRAARAAGAVRASARAGVAGGPIFGMADAGRWALARRGGATPARRPRPSSTSRARCCAAMASCSGGCSSARRRGCRRGASCCASTARLEARGEIRGGRFVAGFAGEQFALPDAIGLLREIRRKPALGAIGVALGRRSAQSRRHPDAGPEARRR